MNLAVSAITSQSITFALVISLGLFFLYLQLQRLARLARGRENTEPKPPENADSHDPDDQQES